MVTGRSEQSMRVRETSEEQSTMVVTMTTMRTLMVPTVAIVDETTAAARLLVR